MNSIELAVKNGYYFLIDRNDSIGNMHIDIGKGYQNDHVTSVSLKEEKGFLFFYMNDEVTQIRDLKVIDRTFVQVADEFLNEIVKEYTKSSCYKLNANNEFEFYFERENA